MRKALTVTAYVVVSALVFVATWKFTGGSDSLPEANPGSEQTTDTTASGNGQPGAGNNQTGTGAGSTDGSPSGNEAPSEGSLTTELLEPPAIAELARRVSSYMSLEGVNPLAAARVVTYTIVTYGDVKRPDDGAGLLSDASKGTESREALHAAARVAAELAELPNMKADIDKWVDEPTGTTKEVVDAILERASKDGYAEAVNAVAAKYSGEFAWKPGGQVFPKGLEPGWGTLKPILGSAKCSVPAPDTASMKAQGPAIEAAAKEVAAGIDQPAVFDKFAKDNRFYWLNSPTLNPAFVSLAGYVVLTGEAKSEIPENAELRAMYAMVGAYDALIATWKAKWEHGIAGPVDKYPVTSDQSDIAFSTAAPSYPSWVGTYQGFMESFASSTTGKELTFAGSNDIIGVIDAANKSLANPLMHWEADLEAGRNLGACYAAHTAEVLKANG